MTISLPSFLAHTPQQSCPQKGESPGYFLGMISGKGVNVGVGSIWTYLKIQHLILTVHPGMTDLFSLTATPGRSMAKKQFQHQN